MYHLKVMVTRINISVKNGRQKTLDSMKKLGYGSLAERILDACDFYLEQNKGNTSLINLPNWKLFEKKLFESTNEEFYDICASIQQLYNISENLKGYRKYRKVKNES